MVTGLELESPGRLDEAGYRRAVADLVNFLVYLGEPIKLKRQQIGAWVIVYLLVLLVVDAGDQGADVRAQLLCGDRGHGASSCRAAGAPGGGSPLRGAF